MKKLLNTKGYTLTELLVVISITILFSTAMMMSSNTATSKREEFRKNVDEVITLFKSARNLAITNEVIDPGTGESSVPEGGFGVYVDIDNSRLVLFADTHDGTEPNLAIPNGPNAKFDEEFDVLHFGFPEIHLGKNAVIESISLDGSKIDATASPYKFLTVIFKPLEADVIINDNNPVKSFKEMEIIFSSPWEKRSIKLNKVSKFFELKIVE